MKNSFLQSCALTCTMAFAKSSSSFPIPESACVNTEQYLQPTGDCVKQWNQFFKACPSEDDCIDFI